MIVAEHLLTWGFEMGRRSLRGTTVLVAAVTFLTALPALTPASAADSGGIEGFFSRAFGFGGGQTQSAPPIWQDPDDALDRPLIVRPHRKRTTMRMPQVVKGPTVPVSIFEDKTLRRGDAVMTAQGIRIFQGSRSLPYNAADFVAISDADGVSKTVQKALVAIDNVPRT